MATHEISLENKESLVITLPGGEKMKIIANGFNSISVFAAEHSTSLMINPQATNHVVLYQMKL